jgi:hypothetical protein
MDRLPSFAVAATALLLMTAPAVAQGSHDAHHLADPAAATAAAPADPASGKAMRSGMIGMGGGSTQGGMPMMAMGGLPMAMMMGHLEGRIAFLKTELKITDAQLPLWNAVAEAIRANAGTLQESGGAMMAGMSEKALPERLAEHEKMMSAHLAAIARLRSAVIPLYQSLTHEQKKTANELLASPMVMM